MAQLVPLERLCLPVELNGRQGLNRGQGPRLLEAEDDLQAIQAWLGEYRHSPCTLRHYRKEAERLLLWALVERGRALADLSREDLLRFEAFLGDPQPAERWCGPRAARFSCHWRPFRGPLSPASRRTALGVLYSLFTYLVQGGYLAANPLVLGRRQTGSSAVRRQAPERYLDHRQWTALLEAVEYLPGEEDTQRRYRDRARFLVSLLYLLGPRVGEVAGHTMGSFRLIRGRWWWQVTGKGNREGRVPVNGDMLAALKAYRRSLGLDCLPAPDEPTALVLDLKGQRGIGANMIYRIIKDLVGKAAARLKMEDPHRAAHLRQASTHWFRHTSISHQADAGIQLDHLRRNARHARLDTTALYLHVEDERWHRAMERHKLREEPMADHLVQDKGKDQEN